MIKTKILSIVALLIGLLPGMILTAYAAHYTFPDGTTILNNDYVKVQTAVQDSEATLIKNASDQADVEPTTVVYSYNNEKTNLTTYKDGATMQITGNTSKSFANGAYITVNGTAYTSIKNSNDVQITFTAATNEKIYRMTFYAVPHKDGDVPKFTEFNGVTFTEPIKITDEKDGTKPTQTIMCANGATSVTFTYGGKQVNFVVDVDYNESGYDSQYDPKQATSYTLSLKEGTEDATNWQGKAGEGNYQALPLEGVAAGTAVSVKYNGKKKVKSVKGKKKQ